MKLDGYRTIAFKTGGTVYLRSRNNKEFALRYPNLVDGLAKLPDETVIAGEVVAFDEEGKPSVNALQNYGSTPAPVMFFVFDLLMLAGTTSCPNRWGSDRRSSRRRCWRNSKSRVATHDANLSDLIAPVKAQGLEGLVAKRRDSR